MLGAEIINMPSSERAVVVLWTHEQRLHQCFRYEHYTQAAMELSSWQAGCHSSDSWDLKLWMRSFMYLAMGV